MATAGFRLMISRACYVFRISEAMRVQAPVMVLVREDDVGECVGM